MSASETGVIFDFDGLLVDTARVWLESERAAFSAVGVEVTEEEQRLTADMTTSGVTDYWFAKSPWHGRSKRDLELDVIHRVRDALAQEPAPMPGALRLIDRCSSRGMRLGVATNAPGTVCRSALRRLAVDGEFGAVISADDVSKGKPEPDSYLKCAAQLGLRPQHCTVFEDTPSGIEAAVRAGMFVVGVPSVPRDAKRVQELADLCIPSLEAVSEQLLDQLAARATPR
ncbi:MAG: HAD family phosphatase [Pseudomonadota bacterium]